MIARALQVIKREVLDLHKLLEYPNGPYFNFQLLLYYFCTGLSAV